MKNDSNLVCGVISMWLTILTWLFAHCMLGNFSCFCCCLLIFFQNKRFQEIFRENNQSVTVKSLDPDQD